MSGSSKSAVIKLAFLTITLAGLACGADLPFDPGLGPPDDPPPAVPAAVPARLAAVSPVSISGTVGTAVATVPAVQVTDAAGHPLAGVTVSFTALAGNGEPGPVVTSTPSAVTAVVLTDDRGTASVARWRLGGKAGPQTLTASADTLPPVVFTANALAGPVARISPFQGNGQIAYQAQVLPVALSVRVTDAFANPIPDRNVSFEPVPGSGSVEHPSAATDSSGVASAGLWTLGESMDEQRLIATIDNIEAILTATVIDSTCAGDCPLGRIAFVREGQIYTIRPDGTDLRQLTISGMNTDPAWSPDGRRIAFVSDRAGWCCDIYVMDADGSNVTRRTNLEVRPFGNYVSGPAWSPDGQRIAFSSVMAGDFRIAVTSAINGGDSTLTRIGFDRGYNAWPTWSPDGRRIAWISDWAAFDFVFDIYVIHVDGSGTQKSTGWGTASGVGKEYFQPAWSPDGTTIAAVQCPPQFNQCDSSSIALMNPDGSEVRVVAQAGGYSRPAWSPDGKRIVFARHGCLISVKPDGSDQRALVCNAETPAWGRSVPE